MQQGASTRASIRSLSAGTQGSGSGGACTDFSASRLRADHDRHVTGTVKDAQGGVIPGATVTLISETRGTQSADVYQQQRRLRLRERPADTYTIEVTMPLQDAQDGPASSVSAGDRVAVGDADDRSRRRSPRRWRSRPKRR